MVEICVYVLHISHFSENQRVKKGKIGEFVIMDVVPIIPPNLTVGLHGPEMLPVFGAKSVTKVGCWHRAEYQIELY